MKVSLELSKVPNQDEALKYIGQRVAVGQRTEIQVTRAQQVLDTGQVYRFNLAGSLMKASKPALEKEKV